MLTFYPEFEADPTDQEEIIFILDLSCSMKVIKVVAITTIGLVVITITGVIVITLQKPAPRIVLIS